MFIYKCSSQIIPMLRNGLAAPNQDLETVTPLNATEELPSRGSNFSTSRVHHLDTLTITFTSKNIPKIS